MDKAITTFDGVYRFLSNFYEVVLVADGLSFPTAEHLYQACKTPIRSEKLWLSRQASPGRAKRGGKTVTLKSGWDDIRDEEMLKVLRIKFAIRAMRDKLLETRDADIVEGNSWHDNYWGVCSCSKCPGDGRNRLGKLLMQVRGELRKQAETVV